MSSALEEYQGVLRSFAPQAVAILAAIMVDQDASAMTRLRAAKLILNLAWGSPRVERVTLPPAWRALLGMDKPRRRFAAMVSGLDIRYDLGEGHPPLLGRRMPDLDLVTAKGPAAGTMPGRSRHGRIVSS
jgi:hypothetical protein